MGKVQSCCYAKKKRIKEDHFHSTHLPSKDQVDLKYSSENPIQESITKRPDPNFREYIENIPEEMCLSGAIPKNRSETILGWGDVEKAQFNKKKDLESFFDLGEDFRISMDKSVLLNANGFVNDQDRADWMTNSLRLITKELEYPPPVRSKVHFHSEEHKDDNYTPSLKDQADGNIEVPKSSSRLDALSRTTSKLNPDKTKTQDNALVMPSAEMKAISKVLKNNYVSSASAKKLEKLDIANSGGLSNKELIFPNNIDMVQSMQKSRTNPYRVQVNSSGAQEDAALKKSLESPSKASPTEHLDKLNQGPNVPDAPANLNYDPVLNKNLKPNNILLDDSILEEQGFASTSKLIITESSKIDGHFFPIWNKRVHEEMKHYCQLQGQWEDPKFSFNMKKLQEIYATEIMIERITSQNEALIFDKELQISPSFKQGKVWTSSLISVLIVIMDFESRKKGNFTEAMIYPQDNFKHIVNPVGKYGVKLFFNGSRRLIEVDDRLVFELASNQTTTKTKALLGVSSINKREFRASLIEKAICKLYSSDTMILPSIPSIECYHLTGWTPEIIKVNEIANTNHLWQRLTQNYRENNILISLGTKSYEQSVDANTLEYQQGCYKDPTTDIILDHSYAVLNLTEVNSHKCVKLKNPWGHTHAKLFNAHNFDKETVQQILEKLGTSKEEINRDGLSIALWDDIIKLCSDIYLNWNPNVYPFRQTIHSKRMIPPDLYNQNSKMWNEEYSLEYFPQFQFKIPPHSEDFEVRVFFERHVDSLQQDNFFSLSYRLFSYSGDRVILPNDALRSHPWHPRELLSDVFIFEASKEVEIYVLVLLCQPLTESSKPSLRCQAFNFTLEIFSFIEVEIIELPYRQIEYREVITQKFNDENMGGNVLSPLFLNNPKYVLNVKEPSDFQFKVEGPDESSLMLLVIPTEGLNLRKAPLGRIAFQNFVGYNPGFYFQGFSNYKLHLDPGIYVLMISNQNYEKGDFVLYVDTLSQQISHHRPAYDPQRKNLSFTLTGYEEPAFPSHIELEGEWTKENSKGTARLQSQDYQSFMKNPGYVIKVKSPTKAQFMLQSTRYVEDYYKTMEEDFDQIYNLEPPSLGIAIFEIQEDFKFRALIEEDTFVPAAWGFHSKELTLKPNDAGYLVVCLNYEKGYTGQYKLTICSDIAIEDISNSSNITQLSYSYNMKGVWSKENAGGCMSELSFFKNPGYEIVPYSDCLLHIELMCPEPHPLCISLFETDGKRLTELDTEVLNKVVTNAYLTQDMSFLRVSLQRDTTYLLIPSTFRSAQFGKFDIKIESTEKLDIYDKKSIPYKQVTTFTGEWTFETNMGPADSPKFLENPSMLIKILEPTLIRIHLCSPGESTYSIAIHLYEIHEQNELNFLQDSGSYTNMRMGCFIEKEITKPNENGYLLVFSNFEIDKYGEFLVEISSLKPNSVRVEKLFSFGEVSVSSLE